MATTVLFSSETKRDLLLLAKRRGSISLVDAEAATGLSRTTLREHLNHLERDGLVRRHTRKKGRGRPSLRYELTKRALTLFPSQDGVLLRELLDFLSSEGKTELVERFFERFWMTRLEDARLRLQRAGETERGDQLRILEEMLREQGFMPEIQSDEHSVVVRECNCPFPEAVKKTRLPCRLEAQFFEHLFEQPATRITYIPDGSPACTYEFQVRKEAA